MSNNLPEFDKYHYYEESVQNPEGEVEFLTEKYAELKGRTAKILREDFSGTAAICCEWSKKGDDYRAYGIDLDDEPVEYGKANHYSKLNPEQKSRVEYIKGNVLEVETPKADICFAFNFSYFIFKRRETLKRYFQNVYHNLADDGVFFCDIFGGPDSQTVMEDIIEYDDYKYYWDCKDFNPLTNECNFAIHFKRKGEQRRDDVFAYNWRMWTVMEIRDLLTEVGFKKTHSYWEEDDEDGDGNGEFYLSENEENCDSWVTYIAAEK